MAMDCGRVYVHMALTLPIRLYKEPYQVRRVMQRIPSQSLLINTMPTYPMQELGLLDIVTRQDRIFKNPEDPKELPYASRPDLPSKAGLFLVLFTRDPSLPTTVASDEHWAILFDERVPPAGGWFGHKKFEKDKRADQRKQGTAVIDYSADRAFVVQKRSLTEQDVLYMVGKIRVSQFNATTANSELMSAAAHNTPFPTEKNRKEGENLSLRWCLNYLYQLRYEAGFALRIWTTADLVDQVERFKAWMAKAGLKPEEIGVMIDSKEADSLEAF